MPPLERRIVPGIAIAIVVLHLVFATRYGWFRDELYYVACGRRLALGYVDHPPVVALIARLAGHSLVTLRLAVALAAAATILLVGALARAFGGGRTAQIIAALAIALAPYELVIGHLYTMNGIEPVVWAAIGLLVAHALRDEDARRLVWLGPIVGLGILNKHSASWAVVALAIGIVISPTRRLLVRRGTLIGAAIAVVIVLPHALWQYENGFPTREFARVALDGKNEPYGLAGLLGQLLQLFHPLFAPLWMGGLAGLLAWRPLRPFGIAVLLVGALVFVTQAKAYYLGPAFTWLFAAGGVVAERAMQRRIGRWLVPAFAAVAAVGAIALIPVAIPVLDVPTYQRYAHALGILGEARTGEKTRPAALPQLYADMHGWPELAATVRGVVDGLSPEEREGAVIFATNYGEASAIEHFGSTLPVASGHTGWWLWGTPRPAPPVVVWVGHREEMQRELFADCEERARFAHPLVRAEEQDLPVRVCRGPRVTLAEAWPRLKTYR